MRSNRLATLGIFSLLVGCGSKAPALTFCLVESVNHHPAICHCRDASKKVFDLTIEYCDKFVAQPPKDAKALRTYVLGLEKDLATCEAHQKP